MFLDLAAGYGIDLAGSTHVGDAEKDRVAATAAGVGTFVPAREFFGWYPSPAGASAPRPRTRIRARRGIRTEVVSG